MLRQLFWFGKPKVPLEFKGASTRRSEPAAGPVICSDCKSKGVAIQVVGDHPPKQVKTAGKSSQSGNSSLKMSPSGSTHEAMPFPLGEADMISGNLPSGYNLGVPITLQGKDSKQKSKLIVDDECSIGLQDRLHRGAGLKLSEDIQMKPRDDYEELLSDEENPLLWDPSNVHRKSRSKLPQYTPSPIERFVSHLYFAADDPLLNNISGTFADEDPKYDEFLIYEKPKFIPDNEIGLGCVLLAAPVSPRKDKTQPTTTSAKSFTPGGASALAKNNYPEASATSAKSLNPGCSAASVNDLMPAEPLTYAEDDASRLFDVPEKSDFEKDVRGGESPPHETIKLRALDDIYAHGSASEEKSTDKCTRSKKRLRKPKPRGNVAVLEDAEEIIKKLDETSLVDVPFTCSFDENINLGSFEECDVGLLFSDIGEKMTLLDLNKCD